MKNFERHNVVANPFVTALVLAVLATTTASLATAAVEIIPSIGLTKSTDDNAGDAKFSGGLAVRAPLLPFLLAEGGVSYRQDSFGNDDFKVRQWPVTASLWVAPVPMVYAGGGVGWYYTTVEFPSSAPYNDATTSKMGLHLGGGVNVPMAPHLGLDLSGRYIFMQEDEDNLQVPTSFDPGFWTTSLGLAIKF